MVRVWTDHFQVIDVNKDCFEVRGVGYPDADIVPLLRAVNTAFDPATIHEPTTAVYKEFFTGRRHTLGRGSSDVRTEYLPARING